MRPFVRVLIAVASVLTVASPASAGPIHSVTADRAFVERMVYGTSMKTFVASVGVDPWFDWRTDFCTAPVVGNTGRSFNFTDPCRRHDFAYRNLRLLERRYGVDSWNGTTRRRADQQFLADMKDHCRSRRWYDKPTCYAWAEVFYEAVRLAGGL